MIQAFEQHHPGRWPPPRPHRRQRHGVGLQRLGMHRLVKPLLELHQRVCLDMGLVELCLLVAAAHLRQIVRGFFHGISIRQITAPRV